MFLFLLIFTTAFIFPIASTKWDPFTFYFTMTCRHNDKPMYWYRVRFFEEDMVSSDDPITPVYEENYYSGTISRTFLGKMDGDGPLATMYIMYAAFEHDCTMDGRRVKLFIHFDKPCLVGDPCYKTHSVDLTDLFGWHYVPNLD